MGIQNDNMTLEARRRLVISSSTLTSATSTNPMLPWIGKIRLKALHIGAQNLALSSIGSAGVTFKFGTYNVSQMATQLCIYSSTSANNLQIAAGTSRRFPITNEPILSAPSTGAILYVRKPATVGTNSNIGLEYEIVDTSTAVR